MLCNIIWDVDGTLFDTYPPLARAIKAALNDLGHNAPLAWTESLARESLGHCASVLTEKYHLAPDEFDRAFDEQYSHVTAAENPPFPGVIDVCQYICSVGGKNVIVTHRGRQGTMAFLAAHNMIDYFAGCLTGDDGYPRKPDPAIFKAALATYQLKRAETLTVGDRDIDILGGQAAGLWSCFYGSASDEVKADLVISNFAELHQYLVEHN